MTDTAIYVPLHRVGYLATCVGVGAMAALNWSWPHSPQAGAALVLGVLSALLFARDLARAA